MNIEQLQNIFPHCAYPEDWCRPLNQAMEKFAINTPERAAAFLGQIGFESGELKNLQENLSYSPQRLVEVWPTRFPDRIAAAPYARNPEKLANTVYANRLGNGDETTQDGFRYRGRGLIQLTGKDNYKRIGAILDLPGIVEMPDSLLQPKYAALSAAAYWHERKLNTFADRIEEDNLDEVVEKITRKVNGGTHGLEDRITYTRRALSVFAPADTPEEDWLDNFAEAL